MATVYMCNAVLDARGRLVPAGFTNKPYSSLFLDKVTMRGMVVSSDDGITGSGITPLRTAATWAELSSQAKVDAPSNAQKNAVNNWLTSGGYTVLTTTAGANWYDTVEYMARQVNPSADLSQTTVQ
jgi:hypothetical protein